LFCELEGLDFLEDTIENDDVDGPGAKLGGGETLSNHVLFVVFLSGVVDDLVDVIEDRLFNILSVEAEHTIQELFRLVHQTLSLLPDLIIGVTSSHLLLQQRKHHSAGHHHTGRRISEGLHLTNVVLLETLDGLLGLLEGRNGLFEGDLTVSG
jgi:hypothetical protein